MKTDPQMALVNAVTDSRPRKRAPRKASGLMALEQRFMFDAAAAGEVVDKTIQLELFNRAAAPVSEATVAAQTDAEKLVANFLARPDAKDALFAVFKGNQSGSEPSSEWTSALDKLLSDAQSGTLKLNVELRSNAELNGAKGAFAAQGTQGLPTIYLNSDWAASADAASIERVLVEEMGHYLDDILNPASDTAGDEGEIFSRVVIDAANPLEVSFLSSQDDHATLNIDGQNISAELAAFSFVNAYAMVYDLNNNGSVEGNLGETAAEKEQSTHNFKTTSLGAAKIDDNTNSNLFSGNDVCAIGINIGGQEYFGWISRPIKSGGIVRGFYFWTDPDFGTIGAAQADGNQDGDSDATDNRGFLLVVDQTWFTSQIAATTTTVATNIDNVSGLRTYAKVGSSSDRVDSALNGLLTSNAAPVANADTANGSNGTTAAVESGVVRSGGANVAVNGTNASGNVLTNGTGADTDANGDTLTVTKAGTSSATLAAVSSGTTSSDGTVVSGKYGVLTIGANGSYSYAVTNTNPSVNALQVGNTLSDVFTYTISDGKGGTASTTLTIVINGTDDAPVSQPDYNTAKETITVSTVTYPGYSAQGNVLTNDSDVDDPLLSNKSVTGTSVSGSASSSTADYTSVVLNYNLIDTASPNSWSGTLFTGLTSAAGSVSTYYAMFNYNGSTYTRVTLSGSPTANGDGTYRASLSATPTHYWNPSLNSGAGGYQSIGQIYTFFQNNSRILFENSATNTENPSGGKEASISAPSAKSVLSGLSSLSGTIAAGMSVQGAAVQAGTVVDSVTYSGGVLSSVTLSKMLTAAPSGSYTFTGTSGVGVTLVGAHGSVQIGSNGSYTYTPTADNPLLSTGQSAVEVFDYTMQDSQGVTSSNKLYITVYGAGSNDPVPSNDSASATEAGLTAGANATGNVITNDKANSSATAGSGVTVTEVGLQGSGSTVTNLATPVAGTYGSLSIASNGSFTYTLDDNNTVVDALAPGQTLTEVFNYKVTNGSSLTSWAKLTITINGANDAPVAVANTNTVQEDSGLNATGTVLANDTDVDNNESKTVTQVGTTSANSSVGAGTTSSSGRQVTGTYGVLTMGADGTYSYALDNGNTTVQGLTSTSPALSDVFRYELTDAYGGTAVTTLTISITGSNEPPVNSFPTAVTTATNTALNFTGGNLISVGDAETNLSWTALAVDHGTLTFSSTPANVVIIGDGTDALRITGSQDDINAALALLTYAPEASYTGLDYLTITSQDGTYLNDSDSVQITIGTPLTLSVTGPANSVSEGSTALFTVSFSQALTGNTDVSLNLQNISTQASDYTLTKVYYLDVSQAEQELVVTSNTVTVPTGVSAIYVRVTTNSDSPAIFEGAESFKLSAAFTDSTLAASDPTTDNFANATIIDDGTGTAYNATGTSSGAAADDDRTITVTGGGTFNEASPYATFTVTGQAGYDVVLKLNDSTADTATITGFTYQYSLDDGLNWLPATPSAYNSNRTVTLPGTSGNASILVRVDISSENDVTYEGAETFSLTASYVTNAAKTSTASDTIVDDGSGRIDINGDGDITDVNEGSGPGASFDDDRPVSVNSITVNEASAYSVFRVTGAANQLVTLSLGVGASSPATNEGVDYGNATSNQDSDLQYWTGTAWTDYSAGDAVALDGSGLLLVRTAIINDLPYERLETFKLIATNTGGSSAFGVGTIKDDGTGTIFLAEPFSGSASVVMATPTSALSDLLEIPQAALFPITLPGTSVLPLGGVQVSVLAGDQVGGNQWQVYSPPTTNMSVTLYGESITMPTPYLDLISPVPRTVQIDFGASAQALANNQCTYRYVIGIAGLSGSPSENSTITSSVELTVLDNANVFNSGRYSLLDGQISTTPGLTGTVISTNVGSTANGYTFYGIPATAANFTLTYTGNDPHGLIFGVVALPNDEVTPKNDDRTLTVNNINVNEASPYAVFTVSANEGETLALAFSNGTANPSATGSGTDYGSTGSDGKVSLQYYNGSSWVNYTGAFTVPGTGTAPTSVLVRTSVINDGVFENKEDFKLTASYVSGAKRNATGTATINDDGTGDIFLPGNLTGTPNASGDSGYPTTLDDDRPGFSINDVTVNEAAGTVTFTVTKSGSINGNSSVDFNFANDTAVSGVGGDYSGTAGTLTFGSAETTNTITVTINNDGVYERSEQFFVNLSNAVNASITDAQGVGTIKDNGTGNSTSGGTGSGTNDDRTLTVNTINVNEASPFAVFDVTANIGETLTLTLNDGTAVNNTANSTATDGSVDFGPVIEYSIDGGDHWSTYGGGFVIPGTGTGTLSVLVRTAIVNDLDYEFSQDFTLTAGYSSGASRSSTGTATIFDDGTGQWFDGASGTGSNTAPTGHTLNDDRPDTDGDGISDAIDIDDDNDGILDTTEMSGQAFASYATATVSSSLIADNGLYDKVYASTVSNIVIGSATGTLTVTPSNAWREDAPTFVTAGINNSANYEPDITSSTPVIKLVTGLNNNPAAYVEYELTLSQPVYSLVMHVANTDFVKTQFTGSHVETLLGGGTETELSGRVLRDTDPTTHSSVSRDVYASVRITAADGGPLTSIKFRRIDDPNTTNNPDGYWITFSGITDVDTDSDGIVNRLDIDSDNDGITDNVEAQATAGYIAPSGKGLLMTDIDHDGLDDVYDANTASTTATASVGLTPVNTDGDAKADYIDTDSDNDGMLDITERHDGQPTSVTSTTDTDSDGLLDIFEAGTVSDGFDVNDNNYASGAFNLGRYTTVNAAGTNATPMTADMLYRTDLPLSVNSITVNEASPYAVFKVTGAPGQLMTLVLGNTASTADRDATLNTDTANAGTGVPLQIYNGSAWVDYTPGSSVAIPMGGTDLLVRTKITNDTTYESAETFTLVTTDTNNAQVSGTATIKDDGTGDVFLGNNNTPTPNQPGDVDPNGPDYPGLLDDDRALSVNTINVNEGSPYAVFTVTANIGETLTLTLNNGTATNNTGNSAALDGSVDFGPALKYSTDGGTTWNTYGAGVVVPGTGTGTATVLVRTAIVNDTVHEKSQDFTLAASYTSGAGRSASGTANILDDGTGQWFDGNSGTGSNTAPTGSSLNDDRALSVNTINVNEGSPYAVFTVTANIGETLTLTLNNGTATNNTGNSAALDGSVDFGPALKYSTDGGTTWNTYGAGVVVPGTGTGTATVLVRTAIVNDTVHEKSQEFTLAAAYTSGAGRSASGTANILDDGTGQWFDGNSGTGNNTAPTGSSLNDDRALSVNAVTVNEASPYAVFTVVANKGETLTLTLNNGTATNNTGNSAALDGSVDFGPTLQYSDDGGATWNTYSAGFTVPGSGTGTTTLLVRTAIINDTNYEAAHDFSLTAAYTTGAARNASGTATIKDDGTGQWFDGTSGTGSNTAPAGKQLDDDQPKPIVRPAPPPAPPAPPVKEPEPPAPPPAAPPRTFNSAIQPIELKMTTPTELPRAPIGDILTNNAGFRIVAIENAPPGLSINKGVTDQFVEQGTNSGKFSIPYDAFMHSKQDAVIKLQAKQASDAPLPAWVQFDPQTGTFDVKPPANFKGKVELKVIARDEDGREATSIFRMFVGEEPPAEQKPQSRNSLSEKIRLAAKRPASLNVQRSVDVPVVRKAPVIEHTTAG